MSLTTRWCLNRYQWTALPMPQEVINRVHVLACQNHLNPTGLVFGDRNGAPIIDANEAPGDQSDDDHSTYVLSHDDDDDDDDASSSRDESSNHGPNDSDSDDDDNIDGSGADGADDADGGDVDGDDYDYNADDGLNGDDDYLNGDDGPTAGVPGEPSDSEHKTNINDNDSGTVATNNDDKETAHHQLVIQCKMDAKYGP